MTETAEYTPHPHATARLLARKETGPVRIADMVAPKPSDPWYVRFNNGFAVKVTNGVGTMWCAYAFAVLAFVSLPSAVKSGSAVVLVSWVSQTFLQLVLLSIIIVGQNILASASDKRAESTYEDADSVLHTAVQIQRHLDAQDRAILAILDHLGVAVADIKASFAAAEGGPAGAIPDPSPHPPADQG